MIAPVSDPADDSVRAFVPGIRSGTALHEQGLVETGEPGRFQTVLGAFACVLAIALLIATAATDLLAPVEKRTVYGLEAKAPVPSGNWTTGDAARRIEARIKDHSRVRQRAHSLYAIALHSILREGGDRVVVGKDNALFLKDRLILDGQTERQAVTNTELLVATVARRLEARGIPFLFLPIPRKGTLDAEYLPEALDLLPHLDARIIRGVKSLGVDTLDLLEVFAADSPERMHYFDQDSHWNFESRVDAVRALGRHLRPEGIRHPATFLTRPYPSKDPRDIQRYMGTLHQDLVRFSGKPRSMFQKVEAHPSPTGPALQAKKMWLFGTSFTAFPYLSKLIEHYTAYEVENLSQGGGDPLFAILEKFEAGGFDGRLPDACVFEYPLHMSLAHGLFAPQYAKLSALPEAGGSLHLDMLHVLQRHPGALATELEPVKSRPLGYIEPARVLRQPNGAVLLRLRARSAPQVSTGIRLMVSDRQMLSTWPAGRRTCDIPLPTENAGDERIDLFLVSLSGEALDLVLESMDLILDVEEEPYRVATCLLQHDTRRLEVPSWQQRIAFDPPLRAAEGKFEILFKVRSGEHTRRPFGVRGIALDGTLTDFIPFHGVQRLGYVTFPSSMLEGLDIARLEIIGTGKAPGQFVVCAAAYRAAPAPSNRD